MAMSVESRYAVLSLDEDDDYSSRKKKTPAKKAPEPKTPIPPSVKSDTNLKKKKKAPIQPQTVKSKNKPANSWDNSQKKKDASNSQWEEWKIKDTQIVEGNFEEDLSQAILLSKMEYEEKTHLFDYIKKEDDHKKVSKKNKKNQKNSANEQNNGNKNYREDLSLLNMGKGNLDIKEETSKFKNNKVFEEAKNNNLSERFGGREMITEEALALAQYEDTLERRNKEIMELKEEMEKLRIELSTAKNKNKKLCQMIADSEMKDKMEVLVEFERLQVLRDELTSEVISLSAQLEQERSKVRALSANDHKNKDKNKKKQLVISTETPQ